MQIASEEGEESAQVTVGEWAHWIRGSWLGGGGLEPGPTSHTGPLFRLSWAPLSGSQVDVWELRLITDLRVKCVRFRAGTLPLGSVFIRCLGLRCRELCVPQDVG